MKTSRPKGSLPAVRKRMSSSIKGLMDSRSPVPERRSWPRQRRGRGSLWRQLRYQESWLRRVLFDGPEDDVFGHQTLGKDVGVRLLAGGVDDVGRTPLRSTAASAWVMAGSYWVQSARMRTKSFVMSVESTSADSRHGAFVDLAAETPGSGGSRRTDGLSLRSAQPGRRRGCKAPI